MLKNFKKKLIAILLIFTMTFSNFALVGKTYAAYMLDGIFGFKKEDTGDTGSSNVEFDAFFKTSQDAEKSTEVSSDIKNNDLIIGATVKVKNSGYLKDAKILFGNGKELNFNINGEIQVPVKQDNQESEETLLDTQTEELLNVKSEETSEKFETKNLVEENDKIQSFENNELQIIQLNADSDMSIEFPINYEYKKYVEESTISKTNQIKFEGIYVNEKAEEIAVSKTIDLKLSWEDEREIRNSSEVSKYLGFNQDGVDGIIFQQSITVDSSTNDITLPIKNSQVEIVVPEIDGVKPDSVSVVAKSLMATAGKENEEVIFSKDNWNYDKDNNIIIIKTENQSELVSTQNENDVLIDETIPMKDMYYSESGADNYLITYTYKNVSISERSINTKVKSTFTEFGKTELTSENDIILEVKDEVGDIVTYTNETTTQSVSKGYTYLNYNNEDNKYEIEIDNNLIFNVSYNDIVEALYYTDNGNIYVSSSGETYSQEDLYYKRISINKENFNTMFGENGFVNIYNNDELIFTINKDTEANEEGIIEINFENIVKNIQIETSKPITDGNINFKTIRAYSNVSFEKELYKNFDKITINTVGSAKYKYLNELVNIGASSLDVKLNDTKTEATLEIGQSSLSTLAVNNNVELKIELNNEKINSDVYGNSRFQIKLPEYIESVDVTDSNIVYGEGLELNSVQGFVENGNAYIDISLNGKQKELSSGIISNGTNIVLNANIKVDLYAPAKEDAFELTYVNDEATNYENNEGMGFASANISYSAPSGVVSVNSLSNYNLDKNITSINQGKIQDEIEVYSDSKTVKTELTIMNNEKNNISDLVILGRIPFKGVKDLITGDDLGTTVDTKLVSGLVPDNNNETEFKFYYSNNEEATKDLYDNSNAWTDDLNTLENVKSFLIVPIDSEYQMQPTSKLRFSYEFEVPANLEHDEEIYGTFATYYTNNTDVATINDVSKADIVGLITGSGPKFEITTNTDKTKVNEYEEFEIITNVKNTGKIEANNIIVSVPIPEYTSLVEYSSNKENANYNSDDGKVDFMLASLDINDIAIFKIRVKVEPFYSETEDDIEDKVYSLITATDLDTTLKTEEKSVIIEQAEMRVTVENTVLEDIMYKGNDAKLYIRVKNLTNNVLHNASASMKIDKCFNYIEASVIGIADDKVSVDKIKSAEYDEKTRVVTWKIGDINPYDVASLELQLDIGDMDSTLIKEEIKMSANAKADGTAEYTSGNVQFNIGRPVLTISQTTSTTNTYVKEGEVINYQFKIKNEGSVLAKDVKLTDYIPDGLIIDTMSYVYDGTEIVKEVSAKDEATIGVSIPAGDTLTVDVSAIATSLNGLGERSVTNKASVSADNVQEIESNKITHIIESSGDVVSGQGEYSTGKASSSSNETLDISKTYKISGLAWIDKDNDGMRSDSEELMKGVVATLVDSDNGVIKQSTTTNSKGEYTFTGVKNGNYIIIFDYDTVRYTVTIYQKENVAQNVNSDVITTKIEQDGKLRNGAVTRVVTIEDGSVSNIDIGLIEALKFDLNLNMGISKITTNTSKGTDTKTYDNSKLTKTEIATKQVAGSSVYIEYTLTVKNEGEIPGFAKKITDYMPEGMEFNSGMNQDWFTGSDGNLYTNKLANIEIQPGETKTFSLVLLKQLTDENLGTISNTAEIVDDYNIYGVSDLDSTPANKSQNEDDFARVDSYLSVKTGEVFIYISMIITTFILTGVVVIIVTLKIKSRKAIKGGVK